MGVIMDWTILIVLVGLWLVSPIVLLIALIISRHQLAEARRQLAAWKQQVRDELLDRERSSSPANALRSSASVTEPSQPIPPIPRSLPIPPAPVIPSQQTEAAQSPLSTPLPSAPNEQLDADWRPAEPGPLEKALQTVSGWPGLIAPFLVQNIGWFIGGFCFVAGALFLVANTSGFINALVVFASLLTATIFLIWAGYQFRRARPELVVASNVLLTLGLMLGPLDLAVTVRLFNASNGQILWLALSVGLALLALAAFAWMARLASALMDRALPGRYTGLLTALAGMQLAAPLAAILPDWRALAVLHIALLGLLGDGLRRFVSEWLRQIFLDRQWTGYFAAGMLVYAGTVSFVHLTWIWPDSLPVGYSGPFLMVLCLLLFPVDAALKEWMRQYAFLSRFSFALYGLSVVAIVMAIPATPTALLTLALGSALYGWMTWRYLTLLPLYLLLGCVVGLYGYGILQWLPPGWHLLASLPGLFALLALSRWAHLKICSSQNSGFLTIAWQCLLVFGALLIGLTIWSLVWSAPSWLGFATAAAAALLGYGATRWALGWPDADPQWAYADAGVAALAAIAIAYTPDGLLFGWVLQTALGWLALAALWTGLGLHDQRQSPISRRVWIKSALLAIVAALTLAGVNLWPFWLGRLEPIFLLALASGILLWMSLGLRQQSLFYGTLALIAAIGVLLKRGYFPAPGAGLIEFLLVFALWSILWWLDWRAEIREILRAEVGVDENQLEVSVTSIIRGPLEQAMALLWTIGLMHLGSRLLTGYPSPTWPWIAGLAAISGLLLIGCLRWFYGVALPMLLGLAGWLTGLVYLELSLPGIAAAGVLYVLVVWRLSVVALDQPLTWRWARLLRFTVPGGAGGRQRVEASLHACAMLVATIPVAVSLALGILGHVAPQLWPALGVSLTLFVLAGNRYRTATHVGAALMTLTLGVWLVSAWLNPPELFILGQPLVNVSLSLLMALAAVKLQSQRAAPFAHYRHPLWMMGGLLYGLALAGATLGILVKAPGLPLLLALLCVALFPVTRPLAKGAMWRGLGLVILISALAWRVADLVGFAVWDEAWFSLSWGYALWSIGKFLLPSWNARFPDWKVTVNPWPWLGLIAVLFGAWTGFVAGEPALAILLAGLALYTFLMGWQRQERFWFKVGLWFALASSYALWLWDQPLTWPAVIAVLPWLALQSGLLWLLLIRSQRTLTVWLDAHDLQAGAKRFRRWPDIAEAIGETTSWLWLATLLSLGLHIAAVAAWQLGLGVWPWYFGLFTDALAVGATLTLLLILTGLRAWRSRDEPNRIYTTVLLLWVLAGYGRLVVFGLTPWTPWDTTGLLAGAGAAFLLYQWTGLRPFYHLALGLPLLALTTAPWQLASPWTGGTLLAGGLLYLSLAGTMRNPLPFYLGVLALNGAIYLWAPLWAQQYGLWQFYLIPAAVSVLALLHLHRRELRPRVLNGARLAALSVLYAGAGLDVFLQPQLWVFALALALALAGMLIGIALRIRAFLYAGVAFLVLNISGQLLRFYPEQGMSRALILLGLGASITMGMVLFNLKREAILQRIRIARADLAGWE